MQGLDTKVVFGEMVQDVWALTSLLSTSYQLLGTAAGSSQIVGADVINSTATARDLSLIVVPYGETAPTTGTPASSTHIVQDAVPVAPHETLRFYGLNTPLFLASGDTVYAKASAGSALHARLSVLEPRV